ncbi:MAG: aminopeptidase P N-terminal domain-containing protein [Bacteroidia bacterium]
MFRYQAPGASLWKENRAALLPFIPEGYAAILFANTLIPSEGDTTFPFRQNTNFYYLTGLDQPDGIVVLFPSAKKDEDREILFIPSFSPHRQLWEGWHYSLSEASAVSGILQVRYVHEFYSWLRRNISYIDGFALDLNEHERQGRFAPSPAHDFALRIRKEFPAHKLYRLAPHLYRLRMVKKTQELEQIRKAIHITMEAFQGVQSLLKEGLYEYELEAQIGYEITRRGARWAFEPIIASGKNSCVLHYQYNSQRLEGGKVVLIDVGASYGYFCADLTRTYAVGELPPRHEKYIDTVAQVQVYAQQRLRPGITLTEWQEEVGAFFQELLKEIGLIDPSEPPTAYKRYFPHGLGHHLGLEVHDSALREEVLVPNMVITCEPGLYIPAEEIGIRIENDVLLTPTGCENLSAELPDRM